MPKTIQEVEEEEEEEKIEYVPLSQWTHLERAIEEEGRRSSIMIPPYTPKDPIQVSTSEDEQ